MSYYGPYNYDRLGPFMHPSRFRRGGMNELMSQRTAETIERMGVPVGTRVIADSYRSPQQQAAAIRSVARRNRIPFHPALYRTGIPGMAAPVGKSKHQKGEAVDISSAFIPAFKANMAPDLRQPLPVRDSGHFELSQGAPGMMRPRPGGANPMAPQQGGFVLPPVGGGAPQQAAMPAPQPPGGIGGWLNNAIMNPLFLGGANMMAGGTFAEGAAMGAGHQRAMQKHQLEQQKLAQEGTAAQDFGKTGTFLRGPDGKQYIARYAADGTTHLQDIGQGLQKWQKTEVKDVGGKLVPVNPGQMPKEGLKVDIQGPAADAKYGALAADLNMKLPKMYQAKAAFDVEMDTMMSSIDRAEALLDTGAGWKGAFADYRVGTAGYQLKQILSNELNTQIALRKIDQMKQSSANGGAVGSLTDGERVAIGSSMGSLEVTQSPAQLRMVLGQIRSTMTRFSEIREEGLKLDEMIAANPGSPEARAALVAYKDKIKQIRQQHRTELSQLRKRLRAENKGRKAFKGKPKGDPRNALVKGMRAKEPQTFQDRLRAAGGRIIGPVGD